MADTEEEAATEVDDAWSASRQKSWSCPEQDDARSAEESPLETAGVGVEEADSSAGLDAPPRRDLSPGISILSSDSLCSGRELRASSIVSCT